MLYLSNLKSPMEDEFLVIFIDISRFGKLSEKLTSTQIFNLLNEFYTSIDEAVSHAGGYVVKYMGDSVLVVFDKADTDAGMKSMYDFKKLYDETAKKEGQDNRLSVNAHFGKAVIGKLGRKDTPDILGDTVNTTVLLSRKRNTSGDFIISAQAYRSLSTETRTLFNKYNIPVCYALEKEGGR